MKTMMLLFVSGLALAGCGRSGSAANAGSANNLGATVAAPVNAQAPTNMAGNMSANGSAAAQPAAAGAVTPDQFRAMLARDGARKTVQTLDADGASPVLGQVNEGIASGEDRWLAIVPLMSTGTDASTSEALRDSVHASLTRNAAGVLRVVTNRQTSEFLKDNVCQAPEMGPEWELNNYLTTARTAVEAVTDPALQAAKTRCLASLHAAH